MAAAASLLVSAASRLVLRCQAKANYPGQDSTPILSLQSRSWTQLPQFSISSSSMSWRAALRESDDHRSSFACTAAVRHLIGSVTNSRGLRFAVVVARFNEIITKQLLEGALATFKAYSVAEEDVDVVWVPGSFEIGVVATKLGKSGRYHAILCIGAVIRGDTTHYDAVANSAASGVLSAGLNSGVPCVFGVLTCDNMEQALNRAGGKSGNKGAETALTALLDSSVGGDTRVRTFTHQDTCDARLELIEMASLFEHHLK